MPLALYTTSLPRFIPQEMTTRKSLAGASDDIQNDGIKATLDVLSSTETRIKDAIPCARYGAKMPPALLLLIFMVE